MASRVTTRRDVGAPPQPLIGGGGDHGPLSAPATIAALLPGADARAGARLFARCAACHSIGRDGPDLDGPNLFGVLGAPIAQRRGRFAYTAALRHAGGSWDVARMDAWLTAPRRFAPGTSMAFQGLADPQQRADIIAYIRQQGSPLPPSGTK